MTNTPYSNMMFKLISIKVLWHLANSELLVIHMSISINSIPFSEKLEQQRFCRLVPKLGLVVKILLD